VLPIVPKGGAMVKLSACFLLLVISATANTTNVENLKVGLSISSKGQRAIFYQLARDFEQKNPDIKIKYTVMGNTDYKLSIDRWLAKGTAFDVLYWHSGQRLYRYAQAGLISPIDNLWQEQQWDKSFAPGLRSAVSVGGKTYGLPVSYYHWGFYYKKSLFKHLSIKPPQTWPEFLAACAQLKAQGITPLVVGTKNKWPAAAWFDYFNLRLNGLEFHQQLMAGNIPYTDQRVRNVFVMWSELVTKGYFVESAHRLTWKSGLPLIYRNRAAMTLIGNFIEQHLPTTQIDDIGFFKFPIINQELPFFEEAPLDIFMLPKHSNHLAAGQRFLAFMATARVQEQLNQEVGFIPPNQHAKISASYFINHGVKTLQQAQGFSQFYDRETPKEMAELGINIFADFLDDGDISSAIARLEQARKISYRIK